MNISARICSSLITVLITVLASGHSQDPTLSRALLQADEQQKPLLLLFTSTHCDDCATITAYLDRPEVRQALEEKFITARVAIEDFDGRACSEIYQVEKTPALLVVNQSGQTTYRKEGIISLSELEDLVSGPAVAMTSTDESVLEDARPSATPGYSVQLGFFSGRDNAVALRNKAGRQGYDVYINNEPRDGTVYYRVLVGHYTEERQARLAMNALDKSGFSVNLHMN